eukprot:CAMPEP_0174384302 /NCGR_PEP_ID=MMETSP0811_2-20130205/125826_1 /TAXON_ID=73025 ORGANISM="Eutreptiella gymnastica-like, Strain CCMP1594" /NCGR_SAMPLE_ID=MMETSP0811_2 /ASSEMBLY_ACC=CAM_ASM_000667 /LENGTH=43 /DNA_ID= /DNA_START= /DNA_END= /DNA_ORIENTATION=
MTCQSLPLSKVLLHMPQGQGQLLGTRWALVPQMPQQAAAETLW